MDRRYIHDHQVIERYLRGTLTPEETRAFEEAYVEDPDLVEEIELAERLAEGIKGVAARETNHSASAARSGPWFGRHWAAAASVLLVVSLAVSGGLYRENLTLRQSPVSLAATSTRLMPVITVRGGAEVALEAPGENAWAVLLVDPGPSAHDRYRASVARRSGERLSVVWSADGLLPEYQEQLALGMPGSLLEPGNYEIEISGRMNDWPAERFEPVARIALRIDPRDRTTD